MLAPCHCSPTFPGKPASSPITLPFLPPLPSPGLLTGACLLLKDWESFSALEISGSLVHYYSKYSLGVPTISQYLLACSGTVFRPGTFLTLWRHNILVFPGLGQDNYSEISIWTILSTAKEQTVFHA